MKINKLKRAVIKEEFVAITKDTTKAIILNQFIYWSERVNDFDKFIQEENERNVKYHRASIDGEFPMEYPLGHGWIFKKANESPTNFLLCTG